MVASQPVQHRSPDPVPAAPTPDWSLQHVARAGAPPLRFKGAQVSRHGDEVFVALYARKVGGFVLAYSQMTDGEVQQQAMVLPTLEDAMTEVEALCPGVTTTLPAIDGQARSVTGVLRALAFHQRFARIAGLALADWDAGRWVRH